MSKFLLELGTKFEWVGEKVGGSFLVLSELTRAVGANIKLLWTTLSGMVGVVYDLLGSLVATSGELTKSNKNINTFRGAMGSLALIIETVGYSFGRSAIRMKLFFDMIRDRGKGVEQLEKDVHAASKSMDELFTEHMKSQEDIKDYMENKPDKKPHQDPFSEPPEQDALATRNKILEQQEKISILRAKISLDLRRQELTEEEEAAKQAYDTGIISLKDYLSRSSGLKKQGLALTLGEIEQERQAQHKLNVLKGSIVVGGQTIDVTNKQIQANAELLIDEEARKKRIEAISSTEKQINALQMQGVKDTFEAYKIREDEIAKLMLEGVQERRKILESEFKEGFVGADSYIAQRKTIIQDELTATLDGLKLRRDAAENNKIENAKIDVAEIEAHRKADNEIIDLDEHRDDIRLQSLKTHYDKTKKYLEVEATIAKTARPGTEAQDQFAINSMLLKMTNEYVSELEKQRAPLETGSTLWTTITEQIAQATEEQQKLNLELMKARDIAAPIGGIFSSLSGLMKQFGLGAKPASELFGNISDSMSDISKFSMWAQQAKAPKAPLDLDSIRATAAKMFSGNLESATQHVDVHSKALDADTEALYAHHGALRQKGEGGFTLPPMHFQAGGVVPGTGPSPITAHGGESIFPSGVMQQFITMLKQAVQALEQLGSKIKGIVAGSPGAKTFGESILPKLPKRTGDASDSDSSSDSGGAPKNMFQKLGTSFENLIHKTDAAGNSTGSLGSRMSDFAGNLSGIISGIEGMVKGVKGGKTAGGGALSGGLSGASMGMQMGGPWGALIGGVAGASMGAIIGSKNQQMDQDIHKIQDSMQSIIQSMNEGAITLSAAIQDMRQERQAAIKTLSQDPKATKGGGKYAKTFQPSQLQSVVDQIDAQIGQLVQQQQVLLSQLDQQVAVLSNPLPFQQYAQSLDQIIQKYQQFASAAAGNAQAVGNAQLFLNESLQAYVTTLSQQLNQAQQSAIQDSLTLLNLEYQRQQIINQEAQQEYDILTQGVLTRQRTTAMTKGQEIGQLQYQANMQLQQIDEQIALQQYKVATEQQIFNLATTRIGLETQLLTLQEQQADTQNGQTQALLQVVEQLQAGMANGTLMAGISALGPTGTGTGILTTLLGELGLGGNVPTSILTGAGGATNYLSQIPQQYQAVTNFINNLDPAFLQNLWSAMQTPAGSSQRQAVLQEAAPYSQDAMTNGYDWNGFQQWVQGGAAIQGSTATVTNSPAPTGPETLPTGTSFPEPTTPGTAPSTIPNYSATTQSMTALNSSVGTVATSMTTLAQNIQALATGIAQVYTATPGSMPVYLTDSLIQWAHSLPQYATGGLVPETGPAIVDEGEFITPAGGMPPGMVTSSSGGGTDRLAVENSLLDITTQRTGMEMSVISARQDQISSEMLYIQSLQQIMAQISNMSTSGPAGNLESLFGGLYQTRGRYGSGGFRREYL
jgi:hypothetical protein